MKYGERGVGIRKGDRANQEATAYPMHATTTTAPTSTMAQQPEVRPGPPHHEVSGSCGRIPWKSDQLITKTTISHPEKSDTCCLCGEKPETNSLCSVTWTDSALSELYFPLIIPA
jgi:hypothetical protein